MDGLHSASHSNQGQKITVRDRLVAARPALIRMAALLLGAILLGVGTGQAQALPPALFRVAQAQAQPAAGADFVQGDYWALIIGISEYPNLPPAKQLTAPKNDADRVARVLRERYGFAREQAYALFDAQATRGGILRHLRGLAKDVGPNDSLFVYFAGHCQVDPASKEVWWLPADAQEDDPTSFISLNDLRSLLEQIQARHLYLVADSCTADTLLGVSRIAGTPTVRQAYQKKSRWALALGAATGAAQQPGPSLFTGAFVKALQDHQEMYLTPLHIAALVLKQLPAPAAQALRSQPLLGMNDDGGQFVFRLDGATPPAVETRLPSQDDPRAATLRQQIEATRALSLPQNIKDQAIAALQSQVDAIEKEVQARIAEAKRQEEQRLAALQKQREEQQRQQRAAQQVDLDRQRSAEQAKLDAGRKAEEDRRRADEAAREAERRRREDEERLAKLRQEEERLAKLRKEAEEETRRADLRRQQEEQRLAGLRQEQAAREAELTQREARARQGQQQQQTQAQSEAEAQRQAEAAREAERKRQQQEEERLAKLRKEAEDDARRAELRRQEEQRLAKLRADEEERLAKLRKEAEEQARQAELKRRQEEERLAALRKEAEEQARQAELKRRQDEEAAREAEQKRQQEEQRLAQLRSQPPAPAAPAQAPPAVIASLPTPAPPKPAAIAPPKPEDLTPPVLIPAGEFTMGSGPRDGQADETPQRKVYLDAYHIDKTTVTVGQYARYLQAANADPPEYWHLANPTTDANLPVIGVDWDQAQGYCKWAGKRLPTEAEWEKAARGTDGRKHPWGNEAPTAQHANFGRGGSFGYSKSLEKVGSYELGKSPYNVYDMIGNVWQWVADWYDKDYYKNAPEKNPKGPDKGEFKIIRGGSWARVPLVVRSAARNRAAPSSQTTSIGFRCAKDAK